MSEVFESMRKGLEEAIAYSERRCPVAVVHGKTPLDVKAVRRRVGIRVTPPNVRTTVARLSLDFSMISSFVNVWFLIKTGKPHSAVCPL